MRSREKSKIQLGNTETKQEPLSRRELGKEAEWTIALPLLEDLRNKGIFLEAYHTSKEVDEERGIDFVVCLGDGSHLAVQASIADNREIWQEKAKKILQAPLVELKEIHPRIESLSRKQRIEEVPKVLWKVGPDSVEMAYYDFAKFGKKGKPFDYLTDREDLQKTLLAQIMANLTHFSQDRDLASRFLRLPGIARERKDTLNAGILKMLKREEE